MSGRINPIEQIQKASGGNYELRSRVDGTYDHAKSLVQYAGPLCYSASPTTGPSSMVLPSANTQYNAGEGQTIIDPFGIGVDCVITASATFFLSTVATGIGISGPSNGTFTFTFDFSEDIAWTSSRAVMSGIVGTATVSYSTNNPSAVVQTTNGFSSVAGESFNQLTITLVKTAGNAVQLQLADSNVLLFEEITNSQGSELTVNLYTDGTNQYYKGVNNADPSEIYEGELPLPSGWVECTGANNKYSEGTTLPTWSVNDVIGNVFYETSNGILYISDGAQWKAVDENKPIVVLDIETNNPVATTEDTSYMLVSYTIVNKPSGGDLKIFFSTNNYSFSASDDYYNFGTDVVYVKNSGFTTEVFGGGFVVVTTGSRGEFIIKHNITSPSTTNLKPNPLVYDSGGDIVQSDNYYNSRPISITTNYSQFLSTPKTLQLIAPLGLTTAERDAITLTSNDEGKVIYNKTEQALQLYDGTAWAASGSGGGSVDLSNYVDLSTNQSIAGEKEFEDNAVFQSAVQFDDNITVDNGITADNATFFSPVTASSAPTTGGHLTNKTYVDGLNEGNVKLSAGAQTISGDVTIGDGLINIGNVPIENTSSGFLEVDGNFGVTGNGSFNNLSVDSAPVNATDVANKAYVDANSGGGGGGGSSISKDIIILASNQNAAQSLSFTDATGMTVSLATGEKCEIEIHGRFIISNSTSTGFAYGFVHDGGAGVSGTMFGSSNISKGSLSADSYTESFYAYSSDPSTSGSSVVSLEINGDALGTEIPFWGKTIINNVGNATTVRLVFRSETGIGTPALVAGTTLLVTKF